MRDGPTVKLQTAHRAVVVGQAPRVVGTLCSLPDNTGSLLKQTGCDVVELRVDQMPLGTDWIKICKLIQSKAVPVIITIRHESEGGKWSDSEQRRLELLEEALPHVSAVDVEFKSEIAVQVAQAAKHLGNASIISFHDFARTPPLAELQSVVSKAQTFASIVKITTMIHATADLEILHQLLASEWSVPLCVMGMGELGAQNRVALAVAGSCLIYGYLDKPMAPGQPSASDLVRQLRSASKLQ